jgi:Arc/MetJ-type ribon-helix-helix transcriptional regulator
MEVLHVRFSEPAARRIDARCAALGISRSEYVRRAVDAQLDADDARRRDAELDVLRQRVAVLERAAGRR